MFIIIFLLFLWILVATLISLYSYNKGNIYWSIFVFIIASIPILTISINIVNYLYSKGIRLKYFQTRFKRGYSEKYSTFVVIPTLLPNVERVEELFNSLEVYYLSNREDNVYFGIVGDFKDEDSEVTKFDEEIVHKGIEITQRLNEKYGNGEEIFYYFHRRRTYSKTQDRWMGWERKRGAL